MLKNFIGVIAMAASFGALAQQLPNPTLRCMQELSFEPHPHLTVIADKVALTGSADATASMRALDRIATAEERQALELWKHLRQQCFDYGESYRRAMSTPAQAGLAVRAFGTEQRLLADLLHGRSTYAEFQNIRLQEAVHLASSQPAK